MKYTVKQLLDTNEFAVFEGKKYFIDTVGTVEHEVKIRACELSARWYQQQIDNCYFEWKELRVLKGDNEEDLHREWGDILA